MANELQADHKTGRVVYFLIRNAVGAIWNGSTFETYVTANLATYVVAATEQGTGSGLYAGAMPAVSAGVYNVVAKDRAGGAAAESDVTVGVGSVEWTGTTISDTNAQLTLNRAIKAITLATVGSGSTTTSVVTSSLSPAAAVTDQFKGQILCFASDTTTAALRGQKTDITGSTAGGVLTVTALTTAPASGDTAVIQ